MSLHDFLHKQIRQMIIGIGRHSRGNIYPLIMEEVERTIIELVLEETKGNLLMTSKILGVSRSTLYRRMDALSLSNFKKGGQ